MSTPPDFSKQPLQAHIQWSASKFSAALRWCQIGPMSVFCRHLLLKMGMKMAYCLPSVFVLVGDYHKILATQKLPDNTDLFPLILEVPKFEIKASVDLLSGRDQFLSSEGAFQLGSYWEGISQSFPDKTLTPIALLWLYPPRWHIGAFNVKHSVQVGIRCLGVPGFDKLFQFVDHDISCGFSSLPFL